MLSPPLPPRSQVWGAAFESTGARFATCSDDCTVVVWDSGGEGHAPGPTAASKRWRAACVLSGYHTRTVYVGYSWHEATVLCSMECLVCVCAFLVGRLG